MSRFLVGAVIIALLDVVGAWFFLLPISAGKALWMLAWFGACNYLAGARHALVMLRRDAWRDR